MVKIQHTHITGRTMVRSIRLICLAYNTIHLSETHMSSGLKSIEFGNLAGISRQDGKVAPQIKEKQCGKEN